MRLAAVLLGVCATACITDRIVVEDDRGGLTADPEQMRRVEDTTARLRHLPFKRDVPVDVMSVKELKAWFDRYAEARKETLGREDRFHHRMGILPPTVSTAEAFSGFLVDFVGGVYDDDNERMILVSDYVWWSKLQQDAAGVITGVDWAYEIFLVHELVHALQDQHFGLGEMLKGGVYDNNDDAAFVRKTVLETEANVVGMAHFLGMDLSQLATRKAFFLFLRYNNLLNGPLMALLSGRAPSFFAKQTFSQYELGLGYVERRLDEGGLDALSLGYVHVPGEKAGLPESTEQLLWPRKLRRESLDPPIHIQKLAGVPASIAGGKHVLTNVFGALAWRHWMEGLRGALEATAVADGWGGDRYDIIDDGASPVLLWRTTWDDEDDASQAFAALVASVPTRYGPRARKDVDEPTRARFFIPASPTEQRFVRPLRDEAVVIERRGSDIVIIDGASAATADAVAAELWEQMQRVPRPPLDEARLAEKAKDLRDVLRTTAPFPERPGLLGRFALPPRTMAARLGTGIDVLQGEGGLQGVRPLADVEMRWGFRPGLELTLPLGLTGYTHTPLGLTWAGAAARGIFPTPSLSFAAGHALPLGPSLAVVLQAQLDDPFGPLSPGTRRGNVGLALRPHDAVVLTPGVALLDSIDRKDNDVVILGAALERGFVPAPLVEIEVVDGLFLYESSAAYFRKDEGLTLLGHSHILGLALYF